LIFKAFFFLFDRTSTGCPISWSKSCIEHVVCISAKSCVAPSATELSGGVSPPLNPDRSFVARSAAEQVEARSSEVACNEGLIGDDVAPAPDIEAWRPREGAAHLSLGANGIDYFRLGIPEHVRALDPSLRRELKRSTKTTSKRLALARGPRATYFTQPEGVMGSTTVAQERRPMDDRHGPGGCRLPKRRSLDGLLDFEAVADGRPEGAQGESVRVAV
jgi:hypothetical protein